MEFGFNGFSIKINKDDIGFIFEHLKNPVKNIAKSIKESIVKKYSICLIDGRYKMIGYIKEYGKIKTSIKNIYKIINTFQIKQDKVLSQIFLEDIFEENILIENSGELNGNELDTPDINSFDFVLKF